MGVRIGSAYGTAEGRRTSKHGDAVLETRKEIAALQRRASGKRFGTEGTTYIRIDVGIQLRKGN